MLFTASTHFMQHRRPMTTKADPGRGRRLQELRTRVGLTQIQVAHRLGVEKSSVSRWESGEVYPRDSLNALAKLYDTSPQYITFGTESVDGFETYPAFKEFLEWLEASPYKGITEDWMIEGLRTMRPHLPDDVEPNLEVYKHLHQAMLAMPRRR